MSAPVAPSPAPSTSPQIIVMPNANQPLGSATEQASRDALARLQATGTALPVGGEPAAPATSAQPRIPAGDPDGRGGRYAADPVASLPTPPSEVPATPVAPAPPAGPAPETPSAPAPGEQPPPVAPEAPAGEETDEAAERRVTFRGEDGTEFAIEVDDPELAGQLRTLEAMALRGEEVERAHVEIEELREEVQSARAYVAHDPVGFVVGAIGDDPEAIEHLALYLVSHPQVYDRIKPKLEAVVRDPNQRQLTFAEQDRLRARTETTLQSAIEMDQAVRTNLADLQAAIDGLLPQDLDASARQVLRRDMLADVKRHAEATNAALVPLEVLPTLLAPRLSLIGIDPTEAQARVVDVSTRRTGARAARYRTPTPAAPAGNAGQPPRAGAPAATARSQTPRTGKAFLAGAQQRRATAIPGGGAGAPGMPGVLGDQPIRKADGSVPSIEESIQLHRARVAKGVRSY